VALRRRGRRGVITVVVVVVVLLGAAAAVTIALTGSSTGLSGKSPQQILALSLAAARSADASELTEADVAGGVSGTSTIYIGPNGGSIAAASSLAGLGFDLVLVKGHVYVKAGRSFLSLVVGPTVNKEFVGRWIEVSASNPEITAVTPRLGLSGIVSGLIALTGPISETAPVSESSATVALQATLPNTPANASFGAEGLATITISTTPPYYPVGVSFHDANVAGTISFLTWDATEPLPSVAGAVSVHTAPLPGPPGPDAPAQSSLNAADKAALRYYDRTGDTFAGLDQARIAAVNAHVRIVAGSVPSRGPTVVSLIVGKDDVVVAAWSPATHRCFAIVDIRGNGRIDGSSGPTIAYAASVGTPQRICTAARYATPTQATSSVSSDQFPFP
jgi:hypothetical protein